MLFVGLPVLPRAARRSTPPTGTMDCPDCRILLELAEDPGPLSSRPPPDDRAARGLPAGPACFSSTPTITTGSSLPPRACAIHGSITRQVARTLLGEPAGGLVALADDRTAAAPRPGIGRTPAGSAGGTGSPAGCARRRASRRRGSSAAARSPAAGGSGDGRHGHQRLRVRVARRADHLLGGTDLHDLAQVHHGDPVGQHPGERQVVGDEQVGQARARAAGPASAAGARCGSRRRASRPARPRPPAPGPSPAPRRSPRAGAGRRTARAGSGPRSPRRGAGRRPRARRAPAARAPRARRRSR